MPKLRAPHGASWRGRALVAGEIVEVGDAEAAQLAVHGFTLVQETACDDAVEPAGDAAPDIAAMARKDLLKFLGGRGLGNLFRAKTEDLRALAARVAADAAGQENDDHGAG